MNDKPESTVSKDIAEFLAASGGEAEMVETKRPPSVEWDVTPFVSGKVVKKDTTKINGEQRDFLTVETPSGEVTLWQSAALQGLFEVVQVGDTIAVNATGKTPLGGGKTLRTFEVARRPGKV